MPQDLWHQDLWPQDLWFRLLLVALAVWRVTHLLAAEDGPWDLVARLRARLGEGLLGRLMDCFYCLSLWIAAPAALITASGPQAWLVHWLALSAAACLLERWGSAEPVIHALPAAEP